MSQMKAKQDALAKQRQDELAQRQEELKRKQEELQASHGIRSMWIVPCRRELEYTSHAVSADSVRLIILEHNTHAMSVDSVRLIIGGQVLPIWGAPRPPLGGLNTARPSRGAPAVLSGQAL